jgi:beta-lactamase class A
MKLSIYVDGASRGNPGPAALGVVAQDGRGRVVSEIAEYLGETTNNVAEYRALLRALEEARARGADELEIFADSDLLVRQVRGTYRVKSPHLIPLHQQAAAALRGFKRWRVAHVPREKNAAADALANRALDARGDRTAATKTGVVVGATRAAAPRAPARRQRAARTIADLARTLKGLAGRLDGVMGIGVKTTWDGAATFVAPDRPFPMASVFKIPVLVELLLQVDEGRQRLEDVVTVTEAMKAPGSGVLKELTSEPSLSLSDLAMLMIIISDNTATDILVERLGTDAINRRLAGLGLRTTRVVMTCRGLLFEMAGRPRGPYTPAARLEVEQILKTRERVFTGRAYADAENNVTTPREMVALLELLVRDGALSPLTRSRALDYLRRQQIRDRLPFHLPPGTELAHKTGSLMGVRNDAGILFVPRGPVLVCAFTRDLARDQDGVDAIAEVGCLVHSAFG